MPRYEELRLNQKSKLNTYRSRYKSRVEQSKNNLAKPLVFAVFIIIIFAIIFSIVKTYGPSVSIAFKDFFRIPQPEAIFSEVSATILENEKASFLSTIPGFSFFVPSDDNEAIEVVADETNERIGARVRNKSDEMIQEFASTSRITRDALAPFFNNVSSTLNNTDTLAITNLANMTNLVNSFTVTNTTKNSLENQNITSDESEVVEATTFDEVLKPRTGTYDRTKMKPAYTRRYTENDSRDLVFETNIYAEPIIKEQDKFIEYTDEELENNRKEFYNIDGNAEEVISVRKITEVPKGRVAQSNRTPKNDRETVNISDNIVPPKKRNINPENKTEAVAIPRENIIIPSPMPESVRNEKRIEAPVEDVLPKEDIVPPKKRNINPENKTEAVAIPRENIIIPSPMPEFVRNEKRIEAPVEDVLPKEDIVPPKKRNINPENKTDAVAIPRENIIVPSPMPESIRNNNNQVKRPKENNDLNVRKRNDSLAQNNQPIVESSNNADFRSIITNEIYSPTEYPKETSTVNRVPSSGVDNVINYETGIIKSGIFLVEYDEDKGTITLVFKERDIDKKTFTLEKAILTLLEGATDVENNNNIISIIPKNVELLDIFREDNTVYLNFSSDFEYNAIGNEGMLVQLYQFVYTATQFDNIDNVVFLIEGKYNEFIGAEGSIVNSPFQRLVRDDNVLINTLK